MFFLIFLDDTTRVRLKAAACEGGDYINASFVDVRKNGIFLKCNIIII